MNYSNQSFNFKVQNVKSYQSNKQELTFVCSRTCSNSKIFTFIWGCITFKFNLEFSFFNTAKFHNRNFKIFGAKIFETKLWYPVDRKWNTLGSESDMFQAQIGCFILSDFWKKKSDIKFCNFWNIFLFRGFVIWSNVSAGWQLKIKQSWKQECSRWFTLSVKFNHFWSSFWIKSLVILIFLEGYRLIWWRTHDSSKNRHFRASSGKSLVLW